LMYNGALKLAGAALCVVLTGCSSFGPALPEINAAPIVAAVTPVQRDLLYLPPPEQPIPIAVYGFTDQTGQMRPGENVQTLSRAVTQGGTSILVKALRDAGSGGWFTVVEREHLDNVLRERQIIREMRRSYLGEAETPASVLPSLLFAGILLEGGIISYDSNTQTGGLGARFLAIGASTQYRQSTVTLYLRAVSVRTGEVLANVVTQKAVASVGVSSGLFRYVRYDELLEFESGVTSNEPMHLAVQGAVEKAVFALVMEGARPGPKQLWTFADQSAGNAWLERYTADRQKALAESFNKGPPMPAAAVSTPVN
jgi:curli production assembly/transport component CsgG